MLMDDRDSPHVKTVDTPKQGPLIESIEGQMRVEPLPPRQNDK